MLQLFLALIAGILTIAAPCILLPLPILLGSSVGQKSKTRPLFITLGFVITFAVLGIGINFIVQNTGISPDTIRHIGAWLLLVFAIFMIWPTPFEKLSSHFSGLISRAGIAAGNTGSGNWGGFLTGTIIGIVWAPCAGPILASILTLIAQEKDFLKALGLLVAYAIGAGIPMLIIAYGGQAITTRVRGLAKYAGRVQQVFGVLLILLAAAIYFQQDTILQKKILDKIPLLGGGIESKILCNFDFYVAKGDECDQKDLPGTIDTSKPVKQSIAPEFTGISTWLNTDTALSMETLRGKVVLIDFWTYSCINCIRTLPYVTKWYDQYKDRGLVVVGVHTPEFAFEKVTANIQKAIQQHNIHYPVAVDNDYLTWNAYNNHYWPAEYLIDQNGNIVYTHFGEGKYDKTEMKIKQLLGLTGEATVDSGQNLSGIKSPEIYFGTLRQEFFASGPQGKTGVTTFVIPNNLKLNEYALQGTWDTQEERAILMSGPGKIKLHFNSAKVYMVASSSKEQTVTAKVDRYESTFINIHDSTLYTIFNSDNYGEHVLEITIPEAGFEAFTFTFG